MRSSCRRSWTSLIQKGRSEDERAAIVYNGTLPTQETIEGLARRARGTIQGAPAPRAGHPHRRARGGFRDYLRWFDSRPLFGRRVLVTRPREQAAELVERLTALGAEAIEAPMIQIVPPQDLGPLRQAAAAADQFDWIVFTSTNAVDAFHAPRCSTATRVNAHSRALMGGASPARPWRGRESNQRR